MTEPEERQQIADGIIASAGYISSELITLYVTDKQDAEYLYTLVGHISADREMSQTGDDGIHREHYLDLADSDVHSLDDEDAFDWNTRPIWQVSFVPDQYFQQRALVWMDEEQQVTPPTDFNITPLVCRILYYVGAHENPASEDETYIEFVAADTSRIDAELQNKGIDVINVGTLWKMDAENSAKFRKYAGIPSPDY